MILKLLPYDDVTSGALDLIDDQQLDWSVSDIGGLVPLPDCLDDEVARLICFTLAGLDIRDADLSRQHVAVSGIRMLVLWKRGPCAIS